MTLLMMMTVQSELKLNMNHRRKEGKGYAVSIVPPTNQYDSVNAKESFWAGGHEASSYRICGKKLFQGLGLGEPRKFLEMVEH